MAKPAAVQANHINATRAASPTKQKIVGMEPMLPTIRGPKRHTTQEQKRETPDQLTTTDFATEPKN